MSEKQNIRKKANTYFFSKVVFNIFLIIFGAILISVFLRQMQHQEALVKQQDNSEKALTETIEILEKNADDAQTLTEIFHDSNQDMLDDLRELFASGLFNSLATADDTRRTEVFADMVERSGVDYLFAMSDDYKVLISPTAGVVGSDLIAQGLLTEENAQQLIHGTLNEDGSVTAVLEDNKYGTYYFYSIRYAFNGMEFSIVLGADASVLNVQLSSLNDISAVLSHAAVGNDGFMFAVSQTDDSFLYYQNGEENLTGQNALEAGLSTEALTDGYVGRQIINGTEYYCVSKQFGSSVVVCAVAATEDIYINDKYVLFWSNTGFIIVMLLSLIYAVIVRNHFVRNAVQTERKIIGKRHGSNVYFDLSVFKKVFPLMMSGVIMIFAISFYTQTLLEISESVDDSVIALDEVTARYDESMLNRQLIREYYNNRFLAKARLISYLIEEDPAVLNESSERYYSAYDSQGNRYYLLDDEGNRLKSVSSSARLQELCEANDLDSVYIFDEDGHVIATSTDKWYFTISHNEEDQSYVFLDVLDGKKDVCIQEAMTDDQGETNQYTGVTMNYYTSKDAAGNTVYLSHRDYEAYTNGEYSGVAVGPVTAHRSMLQIGLDADLTAKLLASTDTASVLSSDMLSGGFIVLFDNSEDHICLYSPYESSIGKTAAELGVSANAFKDSDYYGFTRVNGVNYFQYFRYALGYYIGTAIPKSEMYQSRTLIAFITSLVSLILTLILSATVTITTDEEEMLYASMSIDQGTKGLDSAIFNIILPSGKNASTVKAAARWDNSRISWNEKSPEQKLLVMISAAGGLLTLYIVLALIGVEHFFEEGSVVQYILRGNWDRGMNIFALSSCFVVLIMVAVLSALFRIPVRIASSLLGARGETVAHLTMSVVKYGGALGAMFYCLYLIGMDAQNLLASAGVLSLVIGLGAQSLIKDIIAGIFIVFEGEFRVGDIVTIDGYRGTVMDIGLRTTKILGAGSNIKIYNNSDISGVLNMTKEASIATCEVDIEYGQDIEYVEAVLKRDLPAIRENNPDILDGPTYLGISKLGSSGITLLIMCKCSEKSIWNVRRCLNREILQIFYKNSINIPFPQITVSKLTEENRKTIADFSDENTSETAEKDK